MYTVILMAFEVDNASSYKIVDSRIVDETIALSVNETLPTKIGSSQTVITFLNSSGMLLNIITKIS